MICREQGIEKTMEFAFAYVADVTDLHRAMLSTRRRLPQGVSKTRISSGKLFAKDVEVVHDITDEVSQILGHRS